MTSRHAAADQLLDVIATTRSIRRYRADDIPDADLADMLFAATRAPNPGNRQATRFVVLGRSASARRARRLLGDAYRSAWARKADGEQWWAGSGSDPTSRKARAGRAMQHFVESFETIPVIVLVCALMRLDPPPKHSLQMTPVFEWGSVFPACQNLLLAARALGYGGTISGWHESAETQLREELSIPDDVAISAIVTLGRPAGSHGPVRRRPLDEVVFLDRWDEPPSWALDPPGSLLRGGTMVTDGAAPGPEHTR